MENPAQMLAPLPSAFTDDGSQVSEIRMARLMRWLREQGVSGWVVTSEVGEFTTIGISERKQLLEVVVREAGSGLNVYVNVSVASTSASLDLAQHAARHGAKAVLLMPPVYGDFTRSEIRDFYHTIARHVRLPIIAVDPQERMDAEALHELLELPGLHVVDKSGSSSANFVFEDAVCHPLHALGISWNANPALAEFAARVGAAKFVKCVLEEIDKEVGPLRGPLQSLVSEERAELRSLLHP